MNLSEYIKILNEKKKRAEARFNNLGAFENRMLNAAFDFLLNSLDLNAGVFEVPANLTDLMNDFTDTVVGVALRNKDYRGALDGYLIDLDEIRENVIKYHEGENKINIRKSINPVQKAVTEEVINQYTENGLNVHFAAPLREIMVDNLLVGLTQMEARKQLKEYIIGGNDQSGKLKSYIKNTAMQGVDSYSGAINVKIKKDFTFKGYRISGSLIKTSSKQCIYALQTGVNGFLSFEDWEKVLTMARENPKARLIEGTTINNLPLNKLHWGCRHEFTPSNN